MLKVDRNIEIIQEKLIKNLERLDHKNNDLNGEVARSNALSQLANTYIKTCNLILRVEESKENTKNKISKVSE